MNDSGKTDKDGLTQEDRDIWAAYIAEFVPVDSPEPEDFAALLEEMEARTLTDNPAPSEKISPDLNIIRPQVRIPDQKPQLDRRTAEKLRKGKLAIEGRIDLHGMTREIAYEALGHFILDAAKAGKRHVLVITGKGKSKVTAAKWLSAGDGILKQNVPHWLEGKTLRPHILKYTPAQPKDGGSGALYVYLKKKK